jgi:hypothetical protein
MCACAGAATVLIASAGSVGRILVAGVRVTYFGGDGIAEEW